MTNHVDKQMQDHVEGTKYLSEICNQNPTIVIRTQCGTGKYLFQNFSYRNEDLILEFKLLDDMNFNDTEQIAHNLGKMCYLTASQYLYAYDYQAFA